MTSLVAKTVDSAVLGFRRFRICCKRAANRFTKSPTSARKSKCFIPAWRLRKKCWSNDPMSVRRFIRATVKGREFLKRFKAQSLALGKKYDRAPDDVRNADYDATMEMMTADGTEDLETQKSDIDIAPACSRSAKGNLHRAGFRFSLHPRGLQRVA